LQCHRKDNQYHTLTRCFRVKLSWDIKSQDLFSTGTALPGNQRSGRHSRGISNRFPRSPIRSIFLSSPMTAESRHCETWPMKLTEGWAWPGVLADLQLYRFKIPFKLRSVSTSIGLNLSAKNPRFFTASVGNPFNEVHADKTICRLRDGTINYLRLQTSFHRKQSEFRPALDSIRGPFISLVALSDRNEPS